MAAHRIDQRMNRVGTIAAILLLAGCAPAPAPDGAVLQGRTMGTTYTVRLSDCPASCQAELHATIMQRLDELTAMLSHYEADSALSRFNRYNRTDWYAVPAELALLIALAQQVSEASDGAFDVTVAPAVDLWGFGAVATPLPHTMPQPDQLQRAQQLTNFRQLEVRNEPPALRKANSRMTLNLSAIGKGFAVDQLALLLEDRGFRNYLIEIGGEVRCAGVRPDGRGWRIGIERPDDSLGIPYIAAPCDAAIASSGDYRNFYNLNGQRISHTIDPATARSPTHGLRAVSVIAPDAAQADALATALMVLGPTRGYTFARQRNIAALFFVNTDDGRDELLTPEFEALLLRD